MRWMDAIKAAMILSLQNLNKLNQKMAIMGWDIIISGDVQTSCPMIAISKWTLSADPKQMPPKVY